MISQSKKIETIKRLNFPDGSWEKWAVTSLASIPPSSSLTEQQVERLDLIWKEYRRRSKLLKSQRLALPEQDQRIVDSWVLSVTSDQVEPDLGQPGMVCPGCAQVVAVDDFSFDDGLCLACVGQWGGEDSVGTDEASLAGDEQTEPKIKCPQCLQIVAADNFSFDDGLCRNCAAQWEDVL